MGTTPAVARGKTGFVATGMRRVTAHTTKKIAMLEQLPFSPGPSTSEEPQHTSDEPTSVGSSDFLVSYVV